MQSLNQILLNRADLYELVWAETLNKLTERIGWLTQFQKQDQDVASVGRTDRFRRFKGHKA